LLVIFVLRQNKDSRRRKWLSLKSVLKELDFAWLAVLALLLWYPGWQWSVQNWYLLSTILVITIGTGLFYQRLTEERAPIKIGQAAGVVVFASVLFLVVGNFTMGFGFPRQERGYYLAEWLNQNTEPEATIGAWNSGIIGYFADRAVVNLDGVVNNSIYRYKVERRSTDFSAIMDYVRGRQINYLTDYEYMFIGDPEVFGLQLVYESPQYGFRVYRVDQEVRQ
jgi:hypothetical protein